jgi:hypothetical protein
VPLPFAALHRLLRSVLEHDAVAPDDGSRGQEVGASLPEDRSAPVDHVRPAEGGVRVELDERPVGLPDHGLASTVDRGHAGDLTPRVDRRGK